MRPIPPAHRAARSLFGVVLAAALVAGVGAAVVTGLPRHAYDVGEGVLRSIRDAWSNELRSTP